MEDKKNTDKLNESENLEERSENTEDDSMPEYEVSEQSDADKVENVEEESVVESQQKHESPESKEEKVDNDQKVVDEFKNVTRRSFLGLGIGGVLGASAYYWLRTQADVGGVEASFRSMHRFNEFLGRKYFSHSNLAVEYPKSAIQSLRANGFNGLAENSEIGDWKLEVEGTKKSPQSVLSFSLDDIKKLPKQDISINFKCIEGWSRVMNFVGAKFSDFISANNLFEADNLTKYVSMTTPDGEYYVGLDIESAMHPQTLLCYEMNGETLTPENGFPLRLLITVKYGIKNIKNIGTIKFTNERPDDYWAERGYDWYSGL